MITTNEHSLIRIVSFRPGMNIILSNKNKNDFLRAAYVYIADYFEESLKKLTAGNPRMDTAFRRMDESRFMAAIYINGSGVCRCKIWFGGSNSFSGGIAYSTGYSFSNSSLSDSLVADVDNGRLCLKSLADSEQENMLTIKGSAEYFWEKFIKPLKNNSN